MDLWVNQKVLETNVDVRNEWRPMDAKGVQ